MRLGRIVMKQCQQKAHCDVVITLKDGSVQLVRVNESFLPTTLPDV